MLTKAEPTTWRILPTNGGHFQWAVTSENACCVSEEPHKTLALEADVNPRSSLSSMKDLLLQAEKSNPLSNKICFLERHVAAPILGGIRGSNGYANDSGNESENDIFCTGSGRTLSSRKRSFEMAKSLFEGENVADKEFGVRCGMMCFPMFRTGLGSVVQVRQSLIEKAAFLLDGSKDKQGFVLSVPVNFIWFLDEVKLLKLLYPS